MVLDTKNTWRIRRAANFDEQRRDSMEPGHDACAQARNEQEWGDQEGYGDVLRAQPRRSVTFRMRGLVKSKLSLKELEEAYLVYKL